MADIIQIRRDTASNWTSANPTLASGELGFETDTDKIKIGDASTAWTSLGYVIDASTYALTTGTTFTGAVIGTTFAGDLTGDVVGDVTGDVSGSSGTTTGNAATATALATTRTIGGVAFNGTADINLPGVNVSGTQDTSGTAATATLATTATITDSAANTNYPVVFHNESNGLLDDTGALRYNPSTGELLVPNLTVAGTSTVVDTVTMNAQNAIVFEGATADVHETTLSVVDPTADHTQYLINQGGYIPVLAASTTTAITSTPAELNTLDALNRGSILYGNSSGATTVLAPGSNEQVLISDGTDIAWANNTGAGAETLGALNDVSTSGVANGKILKYNGTSWVVSDDTGGSETLAGLTDVSTSGVANGKILKYNGTSWVISDDTGGIDDVVEDTTPQLGGNLDVNGKDLVSTSNGTIDLNPDGSGVVIFSGNATRGSGQFKLNCEANTHGITIKGPAHSAAANYTLTLPDDDGSADQVLKTDGSGNLSWVDSTSGDSSQTLTDGATVNWDMDNGNIGFWTIGGNRTLATPTNTVVGTSVIRLTQDTTGGRTVAWPANFKWSAGSTPALSTAAAAVDILSFFYDGTNFYGALVSRGAS